MLIATGCLGGKPIVIQVVLGDHLYYVEGTVSCIRAPQIMPFVTLRNHAYRQCPLWLSAHAHNIEYYGLVTVVNIASCTRLAGI